MIPLSTISRTNLFRSTFRQPFLPTKCSVTHFFWMGPSQLSRKSTIFLYAGQRPSLVFGSTLSQTQDVKLERPPRLLSASERTSADASASAFAASSKETEAANSSAEAFFCTLVARSATSIAAFMEAEAFMRIADADDISLADYDCGLQIAFCVTDPNLIMVGH